MKRSSQSKGYVCSLILLGFVLVSLMTGCVKQISDEPMRYTDSQISPGHGRLVFASVTDIGDEETVTKGLKTLAVATAVMAALAGPPGGPPPGHPLTYNLFEVDGKSFIPLAEFTMPPTNSVHAKEIFYLDIPVGRHRFFVARSRVDFFIRHLVGKHTAIDIDVQEGQTLPVFFGPGAWDAKIIFGPQFPIRIRPYPLRADDIAFCYGLRDMNTSNADRAAQVDEKVYEYFTDPQAGLKLDIALKALALMQPAQPSDDFKKWAEKKQEDFATDYAETDISHTEALPYDVYQNADRKK